MKLATTTPNAERVYSLDALRAIMMLLGVVIHSAATYGHVDYKEAWPLKDPTNSLFFDLLGGFIHVFRMPVFFVAAGYFSALLFYVKGPRAMLINRVKRVLLPFLAAVLICYPLVLFSFTYSQAAFAHVNNPLGYAFSVVFSEKVLPFKVIHLWFLYYLMQYVVVGGLIALLVNRIPSFSSGLKTVSVYVLQRPWLFLLTMTILLFGCLYWIGTPVIQGQGGSGWPVQPEIFATYFIFFGTGWLIYRTNTLVDLKRHSIGQLCIATVIFLVSSISPWPGAPWVLFVQMGLMAMATSLFVFGFIAFFQRYFHQYSPRLSYLMESSYWVYIIHLPIVSFVPGLLANVSLPVLIKFGITLSSTMLLSVLSYQYLVRGTWMGWFLNGKMYKRTGADNAERHILNS